MSASEAPPTFAKHGRNIFGACLYRTRNRLGSVRMILFARYRTKEHHSYCTVAHESTSLFLALAQNP